MSGRRLIDHPEKHDGIEKELIELRSPKNADLDIVAVPGLGADPIRSWEYPTGDRDLTGFNWLEDDEGLGKELPRARILLFKYNSCWTGKLKGDASLDAIASDLLDAVKTKRKDESRPIVFIGHSMGGLVIAKAITFANRDPKAWPTIMEATTGCLFFGTPFDGTPMASVAAMYAVIAEKFDKAQSSALLDILKPQNEYMRELKEEFMRDAIKLSENIRIVCFYEEKPTDYVANLLGDRWKKFTKIINEAVPTRVQRLVDKSSSTLPGHKYQGLAKAHKNLVQFEGRHSADYERVESKVKEMVQGANRVAKVRFSSTRDLDREKLNAIYKELEGVHVWGKYNAIKSKVAVQSWVLNEPECLDWLPVSEADGNSSYARDEKCVWIRGPPGYGKTGAAISAIDKIENLSRDPDSQSRSPILAFFFCDASDECSSAVELLKSIIRQLITRQETLFLHAKGLVNTQGKRAHKLSVENLWEALQGILTDALAGSINIVLGNLHELKEDESSTRTFLSLLQDELMNAEEYDGKVRVRWLLTSRDREVLRKTICHQSIGLIDLTDPKHEGRIQSNVQSHAQSMISQICHDKEYSTALSYFASTLFRRRAETTKWVDVTCVHLSALPKTADGLQVRRLLEGIPQDANVLLDRSWLSLLGSKEQESGKLKELLRALVLTYESPSEEELAILAGFPFDAEEVPKLVESCGPLLTRYEVHGKTYVRFVNDHVKDHLMTNSENLLGLSKEEKHWQQGVIALRCFDHLLDELAKAVLSEDDKYDEETDSEDEDDEEDDTEDEDEEDSDSEDDAEESETNEDETDESFLPNVLAYPTKYWLRHASEATPETARILSRKKQFWGSKSDLRYKWLLKYGMIVDSFPTWHFRTWTALHVAAAVGYPELAESLFELEYKKEIDESDKDGLTPLHLTAIFGHPDITEVLLQKRADVNHGDGSDGTPLAWAAAWGNIGVMNKLLQSDDIKVSTDTDGYPIINDAIQSGRLEVVELLLNNDVPIDIPPTENSEGEDYPSPLAFAAEISSNEIFKALLDAGHGSLSPDRYAEAFVAAAGRGKVDALKELLPYKDHISLENYRVALETAVEQKSWDVIPILLENSTGLQCEAAFLEAVSQAREVPEVLEAIANHISEALPQDLIDNSLYEAVDNEKGATVKVLLYKFNADPNARGEKYGNALTASANDGTKQIIEMLLNKGATVNSEHGWALQAAAAQGHDEIVKILLQRGADVNACTENPNFPQGTALQAACELGRLSTVELLLKWNADPNLGHGSYTSPIIAATTKGEADIIDRLLGRESLQLNVVGSDGMSPLTNAAFYCDLKSLEKIIARGFDINFPDANGDTAVIAAAERGDTQILGFLLENGADVLHVSNRNQTAMEAALAHGKTQCVNYLAVRVSSILRSLKNSISASSSPEARHVLGTVVSRGVEIYDNRDFMQLHPSGEENYINPSNWNTRMKSDEFRWKRPGDRTDDENLESVEEAQPAILNDSQAEASDDGESETTEAEESESEPMDADQLTSTSVHSNQDPLHEIERNVATMSLNEGSGQHQTYKQSSPEKAYNGNQTGTPYNMRQPDNTYGGTQNGNIYNNPPHVNTPSGMPHAGPYDPNRYTPPQSVHSEGNARTASSYTANQAPGYFGNPQTSQAPNPSTASQPPNPYFTRKPLASYSNPATTAPYSNAPSPSSYPAHSNQGLHQAPSNQGPYQAPSNQGSYQAHSNQGPYQAHQPSTSYAAPPNQASHPVNQSVNPYDGNQWGSPYNGAQGELFYDPSSRSGPHNTSQGGNMPTQNTSRGGYGGGYR